MSTVAVSRFLAGLVGCISLMGCSNDDPAPSNASAGTGAGGKKSGGGGIVSIAGTSAGGSTANPCAGAVYMSGCARPDDVPEDALLVGDSGWTSLAVDADHVYLSITNPPSQGSKSSIIAIPKAGGDPETIVTNTETRAFGGLQQAGGYLYWQVGTLGVGSDQYAAIRRIELPAGEQEEIHRVTATTMAPFYDGTISGFVVDGERVIVSQRHDGTVRVVDAAGGNEQLLGEPDCDWPTSLTVSEGYAYFASDLFGQLIRVAVSGESSQQVLKGVDACARDFGTPVSGLAVIGDTLYFGGEQSGEPALMSLDLSQSPDEALGAETEAKDLEQTEVWPSVWGVSQLHAVADRLFFVERTPADIATLYVLDKGETKPKVVIEGYKLRNFAIEPDGKSGYLMAMTSESSFILPFDVP